MSNDKNESIKDSENDLVSKPLSAENDPVDTDTSATEVVESETEEIISDAEPHVQAEHVSKNQAEEAPDENLDVIAEVETEEVTDETVTVADPQVQDEHVSTNPSIEAANENSEDITKEVEAAIAVDEIVSEADPKPQDTNVSVNVPEETPVENLEVSAVTDVVETTTDEVIVTEEENASSNPSDAIEAKEEVDEDFDADDNSEDEDDDSDSDSNESSDGDSEAHQKEEIEIDYASLDKDGLLAAASEALNQTPRESLKRIREIRPLFNEILRAEQRAALEAFVDEGHEPETFEHDDKGYADKFRDVYNKARDARKEEKDRIEKEKVKNLELKRSILEKLSKITESDETEQSLAEVKEMQQEWKKIRVVPAENIKELWDSYHFFLDKFYDNHSINIELKELDRKKNLEIKIELCKKVDELSQEHSLKRSFILLNKYQDEFRNTGPVPREYNKEIWERFQQACDKLYEQKKVLFEELETERKKHLELKEVLVEKAALVAASTYHKQKEWREKSQELDALMTEWKKIGPVPKSKNEVIWKAFRGSFNTFYEHKSQYFKQINKERKANLILKEDICKKAEELKDSEDFSFATNELIKLQKEWKDIGPVPEKISNALWKRFRTACDFFFERKNKQFAAKRGEEVENLKEKEGIISRLNELLLSELQSDKLLEELKGIQKSWNQIGFVPIKKKKDVEAKYRKVADQVFEKFKIDRKSVKAGHANDHYRHLAEMPSGDRRLNDEEQKIRKKIGFLNSEIQTLENNMEFFGRSAGSQKLKKEIEDKIQKMRDQIDRLKQELKAIKGVKAKAEKAEATDNDAAQANEG